MFFRRKGFSSKDRIPVLVYWLIDGPACMSQLAPDPSAHRQSWRRGRSYHGTWTALYYLLFSIIKHAGSEKTLRFRVLTQEAVTVADKWQSAKKACVINHFWRKNFDKINTLYFNGEENKFFSCFFFFTVRWSLCLLFFKIVSINSVKILFIFVSLLYNLF